MRKDRLKKYLSSILIIMMMGTSLFMPFSHQQVEAAENQDLVITEVMPNNTGTDHFEFFEIHNRSEQPINLASYTFSYTYSDGTGTASQLVIPEKTIEPHQTLVLWNNNGGKTAADFLTHYSVDIPIESIVEFTGFSGFYNSGNRTILIKDQNGNTISASSYLADDIGDGKSVQYQLPLSGHVMDTYQKQAIPTAGIIDPLQVVMPAEPTDQEAPVISHTPVTAGDSRNDLAFTVKATDNNKVDKVTLYYQQEDGPYQQIPMALTNEQHTYQAVLSKIDLWSETIHYYIEVTDGIQTSKTDTYTVSVTQPSYNSQEIPQLLVTEIVPDSTNIGKMDGYEFIEIYNNSDQAINFKDYKIQYRYPFEGPEADLVWPSDKEDLMIPSKETLVFWIKNNDNQTKTVEDFNKQYGSQLVENQNIVTIYSGGMANDSHRGIVIATNTGKEISRAFYNDQPNVDDSAANKGILYRFPTDGSLDMEKVSSLTFKGTPGTVVKSQVPKATVNIAVDNERPILQQTSTSREVKEESDLKISFDAKDNQAVKTVAFYYRLNDGTDYKKVYLRENFNDGLYHYTIYSPELIGKDYVEYYSVATDGANEVTSEKQQVKIIREPKATGLRLNVKDHDLLSTEKVIKAVDDANQPRLFIDHSEINDTFKSIENKAYFAVDIKKTNLFFQNGITMGDEILKVFDDTINEYVTITVPISTDKMRIDQDTVISVRSGTKVSPFDPVSEENRDDFYIKNARLVLSDGTTIYDPNFKDPDKELPIGDGAGSNLFLDFHFSIPDEKFNAVAYQWNTQEVKEGDHQVKAVSTEGKETKANVIIDNSAPIIESTVLEGQEYKGDFEINATIHDEISSVKSVTATLDGKTIELPYKTSSADLSAGNHTLHIAAIDQADNKGEKEVNFSVVEEMPHQPQLLMTKNKDKDVAPNPKLSVKVTDPTNDNMDVSFYQGFKYNATNKENISISQHASDIEPPKVMKLDGEKKLNEEQLQALEKLDGKYTTTSSFEEFPYQRFEIKLDEEVKESDRIELKWNGKSLPGRKVTMYAWNYTEAKWLAVDSKVAAKEDFQLKGSVSGPDFVKNHSVQIIVQDEIAVSNNYDYSFVWISDTQYYSKGYPHIYEKMTDWINENKTKMNIKYVFHTGDLVDSAEDPNQWNVADKAMKVLDTTNVPYGVLAGNHDVGHKTGDYEEYYKYFGEKRFENKDYYGESYKNNRGHYDLISANGNDYIMVYMGWGVNDEDIAWMNQVLAEHPDRMAILSFHEYMLVSGGRSPIGNKIYEKVVVPNKNVIATLSGHYHDSETLINEIDDDGDGKADRKVYQMLADYQGGPEGGQGFMRLLQVNPAENRIYVKTYSPYLNQYNFYDPTLYPGKDEFVIELGDLKPKEKVVATDYFEVDVFTDNMIGNVKNVASGEAATVMWKKLEKANTYGWYVKVTDGYRGKAVSDIWQFTIKGNEKKEK